MLFGKLSARVIRHRNGRAHDGEEARDSVAGMSAYSFDGRSVSSTASTRLSTDQAHRIDESHLDSLRFEQGSAPSERWSSPKCSPSSIPEGTFDIGDPSMLTYEDAEEQFLQDFDSYFEHLHVDNIRKEQYPKLDLQRIVYLNYANFPLFSMFQVKEHMRVLLEQAPNLGSVSFTNAFSKSLMTYVWDTQDHLLQVFNTNRNEYSIIFTTGFTAGYRLFSDIYPFHKGSILLTLLDNHDSVKYVISSVGQRGGKSILVPVEEPDLSISSVELHRLLKYGKPHCDGCVFVYPAQSCLSGVLHSLKWILEAQQNGWQVLLDVSTYLPTGALDLSLYKPDFVLGSLQHMLGYPSGMGFLLVRKQAFTIEKDLHTLKLSQNVNLDDGKDFHIVSEDDNINLLSFAALSFGLLHLESVGLVSIQKRVPSLITWLIQILKSLKHKDEDKPLIKVYGPQSINNRGNIVAFNVIDSTGDVFPANIVEKLADRNNIVIATGYFRNPGLATLLFEGPKKALDFKVYRDVLPYSVIRVSLGSMSTFADVYRLIQFLLRFRDEEYVSTEALNFIENVF